MAEPTSENAQWTVIFEGDAGERSSMMLTMSKQKLDSFIPSLKAMAIGYSYMDEVTGDPHKFKAVSLFVVFGHLTKKEQIKNAKPIENP